MSYQGEKLSVENNDAGSRPQSETVAKKASQKPAENETEKNLGRGKDMDAQRHPEEQIEEQDVDPQEYLRMKKNKMRAGDSFRD